MTVQQSAAVTAGLQSLGMTAKEYIRRHHIARRSMTEMQRNLFDAIFIHDKTVQQAAREMGLSDAAALHQAARAARIHYEAIVAPARPWWRIW